VTSGLLVALHVLHSIRQLVPSSVNRNVYTALVLASLDYGNATLPGLPSYQLSHIQVVIITDVWLIADLPFTFIPQTIWPVFTGYMYMIGNPELCGYECD